MEELAQIAATHEVLVWDLDHTIVSLDVDWVGLKKELAELAGQTADQPYFKLFKSAAATDEAAAFALQTKYESGVEYSTEEAVAKFIRQQATNHTYILFTDNMRSTAERVLKELGLRKYFDLLITKDDVVAWKPSGTGLTIGMSRLKESNKDKFLMIGDSWKDEAAAKEAGIKFFNITKVIG